MEIVQIPGHPLPPIVYTAAAIYLTSGIYSLSITKEEGETNTKEIPTKDEGPSSEGTVESKINGHTKEVGIQGKVQRVMNSPSSKRKHRGNGKFLPNLSTILLGLPNSRLLWASLGTILVNILLVAGVVDVVYRGPTFHPSHELSFARVGYVSDTTTRVVIRESNPSQLPIYMSYRGVSGSGVDDSWKSAGQVHQLSAQTDFTHTFEIGSLLPSTKYQYAISNKLTGFFSTAAPAGHMQPGTSKFTFLTSSCIKPRFPYNPFSHPLSIPGLKYLAKLIPDLQASFMLFLGDFIYVDVPHRFGFDAETYRREYRQVYSSPDWPAASRSLPWLHVIDDHEIANDWDKQQQPPYPAAIDPWDLYHRSVNPSPAHKNASYFQFSQGPASFFMMDTRRHRSPSSLTPHSSPNKTMLGAEQLHSLLAFLHRGEPSGVQWKFVISSIPFTRNWRLNSADTWAGYLHERRIILEAMWDVGASGDGIGVVVLSGDRHEFAATAFPPPKEGRWPASATVHEFSTSPLSMFYLPVRSYWERPGEDDVEEVCLKYAPDGNSKFGAVEMEHVKGGEQGLLRFRLFVDGVETWSHILVTPPKIGSRGGRGKDAVWS